VYFENFVEPASVSPDIWLMGARGPWSGGVAKRRYALRNKSGAETAAYTSIFTYAEAGMPVDQTYAKVTMTVQLDGALSKHAAAGILYRASRMPDRFYAFALSVGGTLSWFEGEEGRVQVLRTWELRGHSDGQPARLQIESSPDAIHLYVGDRLFHRIDGAARAQGNPGVFAMGRGRFLFSEISVYLPTE
jgi:hypothetical protein